MSRDGEQTDHRKRNIALKYIKRCSRNATLKHVKVAFFFFNLEEWQNSESTIILHWLGFKEINSLIHRLCALQSVKPVCRAF